MFLVFICQDATLQTERKQMVNTLMMPSVKSQPQNLFLPPLSRILLITSPPGICINLVSCLKCLVIRMEENKPKEDDSWLWNLRHLGTKVQTNPGDMSFL